MIHALNAIAIALCLVAMAMAVERRKWTESALFLTLAIVNLSYLLR